jgi:hypothetical protein
MATTLFRNRTLGPGERPAPRPSWLLVQGDQIAGCGTAGEPGPAAGNRRPRRQTPAARLLRRASAFGQRLAPAVATKILRSADEALAAVGAAFTSARRLGRSARDLVTGPAAA